MAQIAQQDNIVVDFGTIGSFDEVSNEVKKQLRKAYIRGTIHDVIIKAESDYGQMTSNVLAIYINESGLLTVTIQDTLFSDAPTIVECGVLQPEDYSDDVPYDGE